MNHKAEAAQLLVHYFQMIAKKAGLPWESDHTAEIEAAVEHIIDAARDEVRDDLDNYIKAEAMR
jgi:hypothetical protein